MPGIRVVTDSAADLPRIAVDENAIVVVPLDVRLGKIGPDVTRTWSPSEFWAECQKVQTLPETSAPSPGAFREVFARAADDGCDGVLCVTISGELSSTYQSACAGAEEVRDRIGVEVVDSRSATMGEGLLVLEASRRSGAGEALASACAALRATIGNIKLFGALDTLENLRRGGRIGKAQAVLGSLLSIKPVIEIRDGVVEAESKQRTRGRSLAYLVDKVRSSGDVSHLVLLDSAAEDFGHYAGLMAEVYPRDRTLVSTIGPVIGAHSGPGAVGVAFQLAQPDTSG